jgi:Polyketide cyclase / dehydrase and lipid transport
MAVSVSRRIGAPAAVIFRILADPGRHPELDGSGMLRKAVTTAPVSRVGDVFVMKMHFAQLGDYEMNNHVVEFEPDRRIGWEPEAGRGHPAAATGPGGGRWGHRWSYEMVPDGPGATIVTETYDCSRAPAQARADMADGEVWAAGMARTLERLEAAALGAGGGEGASHWYSVRCLFRWQGWEGRPYEERITLWRARSPAHAIELAEGEAGEYADGEAIEFLGFSQAYALRAESGIGAGAEVFSLLRGSDLAPEDYIDHFFDTGREHEGGKSPHSS